MLPALQPIPESRRSVYMDANATTPLLPEVFEAMAPWLLQRCGNASSGHAHGREARAAVEAARQEVARLLNCAGMEIIFTSGGTESDNLALFGAVKPGAHLITSRIEHHAVLHAIERLQQQGCAVTWLPVDAGGRVSPEDVRRALRAKTALVSVMMANNETGVLQPVEEIGHIAREHGILFHVDAVQAAGKVPVDVKRIGCDLLSLSGHKMHGPQGTGALFLRDGVKLQPMFYGGAHEYGRRAGTENVAGIAGFGKAAVLARANLFDGSVQCMARLRDDLERGILLEAEEAGVNGFGQPRVPNTTSIWFGGIAGVSLLMALDQRGLSVSGGSACCAGAAEPSHVLTAMGLAPERAGSSLRFSLSKLSTGEDVDFAIWQVAEALDPMRSQQRPKSRPSAPVRQSV
ncbi:MAG: cysteine desulfurase family protein [Acidobacteriaceae bacterium]